LRSFLSGQNPADPAYYQRNDNAQLRRLSLTVGYDNSTVTNAAGVEFQKGTNLGLKYAFGSREIKGSDFPQSTLNRFAMDSTRVQKKIIAYLVLESSATTVPQISVAVNTPGIGFVSIPGTSETTTPIPTTKATTLDLQKPIYNQLTQEQRDEIDSIIKSDPTYLASAKAVVQAALDFVTAVETRKKKPLFALSYETKLRSSGLRDDYLVQLTGDQLFSRGAILKVNAGYGKKLDDTAALNKGWRFSTEYQLPTKPKKVDEKPGNRLSFAGEIDKMAPKHIVRGQLKYVIPISDGVEVPISFTVANRAEFIDEGKVKGHIGVTIDYEKIKLADLLKKALSSH
jgi:hypothetical protein